MFPWVRRLSMSWTGSLYRPWVRCFTCLNFRMLAGSGAGVAGGEGEALRGLFRGSTVCHSLALALEPRGSKEPEIGAWEVAGASGEAGEEGTLLGKAG